MSQMGLRIEKLEEGYESDDAASEPDEEDVTSD